MTGTYPDDLPEPVVTAMVLAMADREGWTWEAQRAQHPGYWAIMVTAPEGDPEVPNTGVIYPVDPEHPDGLDIIGQVLRAFDGIREDAQREADAERERIRTFDPSTPPPEITRFRSTTMTTQWSDHEGIGTIDELFAGARERYMAQGPVTLDPATLTATFADGDKSWIEPLGDDLEPYPDSLFAGPAELALRQFAGGGTSCDGACLGCGADPESPCVPPCRCDMGGRCLTSVEMVTVPAFLLNAVYAQDPDRRNTIVWHDGLGQREDLTWGQLVEQCLAYAGLPTPENRHDHD